MGMILILSFAAGGISFAKTDQKPLANNPNIARIQQLKQEIQDKQKQLAPIYAQIQQLMNQIKALKEQSGPLEATLKSDRSQLQSLAGK